MTEDLHIQYASYIKEPYIVWNPEDELEKRRQLEKRRPSWWPPIDGFTLICVVYIVMSSISK
ncbi:MAG: hypothetical protein ACYCQJ_12510 [Nitrososphaerales archaeon]